MKNALRILDTKTKKSFAGTLVAVWLTAIIGGIGANGWFIAASAVTTCLIGFSCIYYAETGQ